MPLYLLLAATLLAQDLSNIQVERVGANYRFAEGPAWSADGYLVYSDIPNSKLWKLTPGEKPEVIREDSNAANGNAYDAQGRLYTCESKTRRVTRTDKKGQVEVLAERWNGKRLNAPNDVCIRKDGHAYFTDPAFGAESDTRELDFYGVFHISPKGELSVVAQPKGRPNGIALSPSGKILYVTNSDERNVRVYDLDHAGAASNEHILISGIAGVPDGMRVDEKGNLYVAAREIYIYSPDGKPKGSIPVGETPSNLSFGDADLKTLYITARTSLYRVRLDVKGASFH